jgi:hypothetical protein
LTFKIPTVLEKPLVFIAMLYRRLRYGYAFRRIRLTRGKFAIVDPEDYPRLAKYKWHLDPNGYTGYAARRGSTRGGKKGKKIYMHHEVIRVPRGLVCDHVNRNGLDNRKANVRPATRAQNNCNRRRGKRKMRYKYKGIYWNKQMKKWLAQICVNGECKYLGSFGDEVSAAKEYDMAARAYHGEFAALNFDESKNHAGSKE